MKTQILIPIQIQTRFRRIVMKKFIIAILLCAAAVFAQSGRLKFPHIERLGENPVNSAAPWKVVNRITPDIEEQTIYSFKYHPDGKSVIIGTSDFIIYRVSLENGKMLWKAEAKMMFQREFDGPYIYDVSPDGRYFLSIGQTRPDVQASERFLVMRSCDDGRIVRRFPAVQSLFWSMSADIDYRYPGKEEEIRRTEAGIGFNWIMTIEDAKFIDGGRRIVAQYEHNMTGADFYDKRIMIYNTQSGRKENDMQLAADPETANWDQPAGFDIAHLQFPWVYNAKRKSLIFGTAHGRIHEMDSATMVRNMREPLVEKKPAGNILFVPISTSPDMQVKNMQTSRYMAISPDGRTVYVSAGYGGGDIQLYAFDYASRSEIFHSSLFDAGRLIAPSNDILVVGGLDMQSKLLIVDVRTGTLLFSPEDLSEDNVSTSIFETNPKFREVAGIARGGVITLIRPDNREVAW